MRSVTFVRVSRRSVKLNMSDASGRGTATPLPHIIHVKIVRRRPLKDTPRTRSLRITTVVAPPELNLVILDALIDSAPIYNSASPLRLLSMTKFDTLLPPPVRLDIRFVNSEVFV